MTKWLGIDIGGANLKVADACEFAKQSRFAMWKHPNRLACELARLLENSIGFDSVALTMSGEMADCFATREEGVCRILEQVTRIIPSPCIRVYTVDGDWTSVSQAAREPWHVAASNWKALASYASRWSKDRATLLVDVGSTTTDIVAIQNQAVLSNSKSDRDRLVSGELVYTGVERSSLVGLVQELTVHEQRCPVINESFATSGDVNLVLGNIDEDTADCDTSDGQPKTRACAAFRLARTVGEDGHTLGQQDIESIAESVYDAQVKKIAAGMVNVATRFKRRSCEHILFSGHGDFLIDDAIEHLGWDVRNEQGFQNDWAQRYRDVRPLMPSLSWQRNNATMVERGRTVVKLGGSLLHTADWPSKMRAWLNRQPPGDYFAIVGGGQVIDAFRELDNLHRLSPVEMHWRCIRALDLTVEIAAELLPEFDRIDTNAVLQSIIAPGRNTHCQEAEREKNSRHHEPQVLCEQSPALNKVYWVRVSAFYSLELVDQIAEAWRPKCDWETTSDSLGLLLASVVGAKRCVLLKSCQVEHLTSLNQAIDEGVVDAECIRYHATVPTIEWVQI